jgi:hypothetical protein
MASGKEALQTLSLRRTLVLSAVVAALPVGVIVLDFDPGALAGCGTYGYACQQTACFTVEISTNCGYSWQKGTAWVYGPSGAQIQLYVRTTMTMNTGLVEGWSLGLRHSAPTLLPGANGGDFVLNAVKAGPGVTNVQNGGAPDFQATRLWTCGFTQGVAIDLDPTHYTTGPLTNCVTTYACYGVTFPGGTAVHDVTLEFRDDVGDPSVRNIVTRDGQTVLPCVENLTLKVYPTTYYSPTPSYCRVPGSTAELCQPEGGGAGMPSPCTQPAMFLRGDATGDGAIDISDGLRTLLFLFSSGAAPGCMAAADWSDDEVLDLTDAVATFGYLFLGRPAPLEPFRFCGLDPSVPESTKAPLGCATYSHCPAAVTAPNLSARDQFESETAVAINPLDMDGNPDNGPDNIVVVSIRSDFAANPTNPPWRGLFRAVTCDGGATWRTGDILVDSPAPGLDPVAAFDEHGNLFLVYGSDAGLVVAASVDGGISFPADLRKALFPTVDRPTIATGPAPTAETASRSVWIAAKAAGGINVYGSIVSGPVTSSGGELDLDFITFTVANDDCKCNYAELAVGPNGEVMVVYQNGAHPGLPERPITIFSQVRPDAPLSGGNPAPFGPPIALATTNVVGAEDDHAGRDFIAARPNGSRGIDAGPDLAWDRRTTAEGGFGGYGRLYLAYLNKPFEDRFTLRINVGGSTVERKTWLSDRSWPPVLGNPPGAKHMWPGSQDASGVPEDIRAPDIVYSTVRRSAVPTPNGQPHVYDLSTLRDGVYTVRVHFSTGNASAQHAFNLVIEGLEVLSGYNPVAEVGANKVTVRQFDGVVVSAVDGPGMQIRSIPAVATGDSYEAAIEVISSDGNGCVLRIDAGGNETAGETVVVQNEEWLSDAAYLGVPAGAAESLAIDQDASGIANPAPRSVYQTRRQSADVLGGQPHEFDLDLLPDGEYDVRIHFSTGTGPAVGTFGVEIEGVPRLEDFNPFTAPDGGPNKVVVREIPGVVVADGNGMQIRSVPSGQPGDSHEAPIEVTFLGEVHDSDIFLLVNDSPLDDRACPAGSSWVPWSGSGRLNSDPPGASQFMHRVAVDQTTGKVALSWYDTRGLSQNQVRFFATYATTVSPLAFAPEFLTYPGESPSTGANMQWSLGDYTGLDFHRGDFYPAWANNAGSAGSPPTEEADVFTQKVDVPPE